ncbi:MAG TPA: hypothetical protein VGK67_01535 [Myxococcales bacterium]
MPVKPADLLGAWVIAPSDEAGRKAHGRLAATFTEEGDLVYSTLADFGIARTLETWKLDGDHLVTEQLSSPKEVRTPLSIDARGNLLLQDLGSPCVLVKDDPRAPADPDAVLFALGGRALLQGLESTLPEAAFPPLLLGTDSDGTFLLERFAAATLEESRAAARQRAAETLACAFSWEGVLTSAGSRTDAVFAEASRLGRGSSLLLAQGFARVGERVRLVGGMKVVAEECGAGWCAAEAIKRAEERRARRGIVADLFAYIRNFAPDFFPKEDQTDLNAQCTKLLALLQQLHGQTTDAKERERLTCAGREAHEAWQKYLLGEMDAGAAMLEKAERRFQGAAESAAPAAGRDGAAEG